MRRPIGGPPGSSGKPFERRGNPATTLRVLARSPIGSGPDSRRARPGALVRMGARAMPRGDGGPHADRGCLEGAIGPPPGRFQASQPEAIAIVTPTTRLAISRQRCRGRCAPCRCVLPIGGGLPAVTPAASAGTRQRRGRTGEAAGEGDQAPVARQQRLGAPGERQLQGRVRRRGRGSPGWRGAVGGCARSRSRAGDRPATRSARWPTA